MKKVFDAFVLRGQAVRGLSFFGLVAGLFCACSESSSVAGTAEEPNQIAEERSSSSEVILTPEGEESSSSEYVQIEGFSSSDVAPISSSVNVLSSSSHDGQTSSSSNEISVRPPVSSSSSDVSDDAPQTVSSSSIAPGSDSDGEPVNPPSNGVPPITLDAFIKQYGVTDVKFDENVLAYNLVYEKRCGLASDDCVDAPTVYEQFHRPGLFQNVDPSVIVELFPKAANFIAGIPGNEASCPFHLLNVSRELADGYVSPDAGFVLSEITSQTLTVTVLKTNTCEDDYKERVFGILFRSCDLSENPIIKYQQHEGERTMECAPLGNIDFTSERVNQSLLN